MSVLGARRAHVHERRNFGFGLQIIMPVLWLVDLFCPIKKNSTLHPTVHTHCLVNIVVTYCILCCPGGHTLPSQNSTYIIHMICCKGHIIVLTIYCTGSYTCYNSVQYRYWMLSWAYYALSLQSIAKFSVMPWHTHCILPWSLQCRQAVL